MKRAATIALLMALVPFVTAVVLALVPVRATAVEYVRDSDTKVVNCGSIPFRTEWSGDAGCDRARTDQISRMTPFVLASIPIAWVGVVLKVATRNRPEP